MLYFQEYVRTEHWRGKVDEEWIDQMMKDLKIKGKIETATRCPPLLPQRPQLVTSDKNLIIMEENDDHQSFLVKVDDDYKMMTVIIFTYFSPDKALVDFLACLPARGTDNCQAF